MSATNMTDEEFLAKMADPAALQAEMAAEPTAITSEEVVTAEPTVEATAPVVLAQDENAPAVEATDDPSKTDEVKPVVTGDPAAVAPVVEAAPVVAPVVEADYKDFFEKITKQPIKANGKQIEIRNAEEALQLIQMGANYTKKMQVLAPHRKALTMLESHGLLDESKLSYLIDLSKRNPEAIKQLIKDSGINPMEIDVTQEVSYKPSDYNVSDNQVAFQNYVEDLKSTPEGLETLQIIHNTWDKTSISAFSQEPELINTIHSQMNNGIYQMIVGEIERQKVFNKISPNVPFVKAYLAVGAELQEKGRFEAILKPTKVEPVVKAPVAVTVAAPKPVVANKEKLSSVTVDRTTQKTAKSLASLLTASDEEFMKQFNGRL